MRGVFLEHPGRQSPKLDSHYMLTPPPAVPGEQQPSSGASSGTAGGALPGPAADSARTAGEGERVGGVPS